MFEGESLARTASQEHAAQLGRQRSHSASSRNTSFAPVAASISRPAPIHETASNHSSATLHEGDLEAGAQEKSEKAEAAAPAPPAAEDEFLVTLKGREHLNPHTWNVTYRWALTGFAGLLVLNAVRSLPSLPFASTSVPLTHVLCPHRLSPRPHPQTSSLVLSVTSTFRKKSASS